MCRSEVRLHKLGDELASDINKIGVNEEDSSINIVSDGEATGFPVNPHNEQQNDVFLINKRQDVSQGPRELKQDGNILNIFKPSTIFELLFYAVSNFLAAGICLP